MIHRKVTHAHSDTDIHNIDSGALFHNKLLCFSAPEHEFPGYYELVS